MASVACVKCFGKWQIDSVKNAKKNMCIHGILQWLFCEKCENKLQGIKEFCEKNHPLNINFTGKKLEKRSKKTSNENKTWICRSNQK